MAGERHTIRAEEYCSSVRDGTHDSPKPVDHGRFLVTSRHITRGSLDLSSAYLISPADFDAINKRSKVDRWDVLISMIGTVGEPCLMREEPTFAIKNIGLYKCRGETEGKWLYYYLRSPSAQQLIREQSRGTTQQYIPLGALRELPVLVPNSRDETRAIVHILGSLDDKIELNRRMSSTLEAMAGALFKSWFVDLDPVRAKAEGRDPGLPGPIADLFPSGFDPDPTFARELPDRWMRVELGQLITFVKGRKPEARASMPEPGLRPLILIETLDSGRSDFARAEGMTESGPDDVLMVMDGASSGRVETGFAGLVGSTLAKVRPTRSVPGRRFVYQALKYLEPQAREHLTGTSIPHIDKAWIVRQELILPPTPELLEMVEQVVDTFRKRIDVTRDENRALGSLRDSLLPKLISGELQVLEAQRILQVAGE